MWILWGLTSFYALLAFTSFRIDAEGQLHHACTHWSTVPVVIFASSGLIVLIIKHLQMASENKKLAEFKVDILNAVETTAITNNEVSGIEELRNSPRAFVDRLCTSAVRMSRAKEALKEEKATLEAKLAEAHRWIEVILMLERQTGLGTSERHNKIVDAATQEKATLFQCIAIMNDGKGMHHISGTFASFLEDFLEKVGGIEQERDRLNEQLACEEERNCELAEQNNERRRAMHDLQAERDQARAAHIDELHAMMHFLYHLRPSGNLGELQAPALRHLLKQKMLPDISRRRIGFAASYIEHLGSYGIQKLAELPFIGGDFEAGPPTDCSLRALLKEAVQDAFQAHQLIGVDGQALHPCAHELIGLCLLDPRKKATADAP